MIRTKSHTGYTVLLLLSMVFVSLFAFSNSAYATDLGGIGGSDSSQQQSSSDWKPIEAPSTSPSSPTSPSTPAQGDPSVVDDIMKNKDNSGDILKGVYTDTDKLSEGFSVGQEIFRGVSWLTGWIVAALVGLLAFSNAAGLFYVAVPIGFVRKILSGGLYGNTNQNSVSGGMMGGMGMMGRPGGMMGGRMGNHMGGGPGVNSQPTGNSMIRNFCVVPASAINAVNMAEAGQGGGRSGGSMGTMTPMGQQGQSAQQINPVVYYLKEQAIALIFVGVALVILVFSSVLLDAGINFGQMFVTIADWFMQKIGW